jgi:sarcosine oxidase, subunit beta
MEQATVAVIGGGVIGASVAYHLAQRGVRDVLVLDRGEGPGAGSTARATGGFRAQFDTPINVRLSLLAREKLRVFGDEIGVDPGYVQAGYLWIAKSAETLDILRDALRVQQSLGLDEAEEVGAEDIARINPAIPTRGIAGGTWCPTDGFIRPMQMLQGYLGAAERLGVKIHWRVEVNEIVVSKGKVTGLATSRGHISVDAVVNAAGAWAGTLNRALPDELPVVPLRRQVAVSMPTDILPERMPMTIFADNGFHLRVRDGRVLLLWPNQPAPDDPFDTKVEDDWLASVLAVARDHVPSLRDLVIDRDSCYAGLYEMSPDNHAILGRSPGCGNLFLANGSSGHGVMHAPALGQLLAEIICDGAASSLDVSALRPTRFVEDALNARPALL